ncbi:MAG: hypothetical protein ACREDG_08955 [Methylocella sp.]
MAGANISLPLLPAHIEETIRSIARLHPQSVLDAIKKTHAEAEQISGGADGPWPG